MSSNNNVIAIDKLVDGLLDKLSDAINEDIKNHVQFADRQVKALAKQAAWIAADTMSGELDDKERDWFLDDLSELSANFARTVAGLTILTIEKAWNMIVEEIWKTINSAVTTVLGTALPLPKLMASHFEL